jgi:hypothetical protein
MPHPLVFQLRFTRNEFKRALIGVSEEDAQKQVGPMNSLSWSVGHLAWQEQRYFLHFAQNQMPVPQIQEAYKFGAPRSAPSLSEMWGAWQTIIRAADPWLDEVTTQRLLKKENTPDFGGDFTYGNLLQRVIYHYWYHTGVNLAIRQMLGHKDLPYFVGDIDTEAPYRPEI